MRFFVEVVWDVVRFVEWHVHYIRQVEGHIKEVYDLFVGFDCDFKVILAEDIANIFLNLLCLTGRCLGFSKALVSIKSKIVVTFILNVL